LKKNTQKQTSEQESQQNISMDITLNETPTYENLMLSSSKKSDKSKRSSFSRTESEKHIEKVKRLMDQETR